MLQSGKPLVNNQKSHRVNEMPTGHSTTEHGHILASAPWHRGDASYPASEVVSEYKHEGFAHVASPWPRAWYCNRSTPFRLKRGSNSNLAQR